MQRTSARLFHRADRIVPFIRSNLCGVRPCKSARKERSQSVHEGAVKRSSPLAPAMPAFCRPKGAARKRDRAVNHSTKECAALVSNVRRFFDGEHVRLGVRGLR